MKSLFPIADLHCDLLAYLEMGPKREPSDLCSRCSHPQLKKGNVHLQTLAIFTLTGENSTKSGSKQVDIFDALPKRYPSHFKKWTPSQEVSSNTSDEIKIIAAFENASGFAEEKEPLEDSLNRLSQMKEKLGQILYITLTWNAENRFGGGIESQVGLKEDGKVLLKWLDGKKIAIDLSHASDLLAHQIIEMIDKYSLKIPLIASHSNFRAVNDVPRNLPDEIAREIIRRKGIIGINFFRNFIGEKDPKNILRHIEHGLSLGGESALCFGADFFCDQDFPNILNLYSFPFFFPEYEDATKYPELMQMLKENLNLSQPQLEKISSGNFHNFLKQ